MNKPDHKYDLTNCDREPIHQLGRIQPFGALLAFNNDWIVAHRSANAEEMLGVKDLSPGTVFGEVADPRAFKDLRNTLSSDAVGEDSVGRLFGLNLLGDNRLFDCAVHCSGANNLVIVEIEPHDSGDLERQLGALRPAFAQLQNFSSVQQLAEFGAQQLRDAYGFDRVMTYRFNEDESGEVIAEARSSKKDTFLGLRYPHSDIPKQARALYVRNRFRIIADVSSEGVPIEPAETLYGEPVDLSLSTLRAVSPIHLEYLKNMGVRASLSVSIVINDKLWGLFACHHDEPMQLPYSSRTSIELFSEVMSLAIERAMGNERSRLTERSRALHDRLMRSLASGSSLSQGLPAIVPAIQNLFGFDGASVFADDVYETYGSAPNEEEFRCILPQLNSTATSRIFSTTSLATLIPKAERFANRAVGALVIPISRSPRDYFVLWRKEEAQTVRWGGNPTKPIEHGPNGERLHPRKSFEAWEEMVVGRSAPWSDVELQLAESLRISLIEVVLRLTDDAVRIRAKAQEQQELLIAELNHRVRNILNLIKSLINQSRAEAKDIDVFAEIISGRISSLASAHDNITENNWSSAPFRKLLKSELDAYVGDRRERAIVSGPSVNVAPEAYTVLALVIHEMVTNAAKYGALCDSRGTLYVDLSVDEADNLTIKWKEMGGPPVKPPKRRGFGTAIIEKSIPFELNGRASIDYRLGGVEAEFWLPGRYIERIEEDEPVETEDDTQASHDIKVDGTPDFILLVEDSMIIAMEAEDCLLDLGVGKVQTVGSVAQALQIVDGNNQPDFVILDYNLGDESSEPVAKRLREKGLPFAMATGYGDMGEKLSELGAMSVLTKPYGKKELKRLIADLMK